MLVVVQNEKSKKCSSEVMKKIIIKILNLTAPLIDFLVFLPTVLAAQWMKLIRALGVSRLPGARWAFRKVGIFPIRDHYYEPLFNTQKLKTSLRKDRSLPGINWDLQGQKAFAKKFNFNSEIIDILNQQGSELKYSFENDTYRAGDSEFLYNMIRLLKPKKLIEIGSGNSTLMAIEALRRNEKENPADRCEHICIEPFERPWLEKLNIKLVRQLVENTDKNIFKQLQANDILFIDSSHMIRPQGDVLFEYLEILPILNPGVYVHVHDIFSPKDYLDQWLETDMKMWNEQYLLEAFLSHNSAFKIVGALNYLKYNGLAELSACCPVFAKDPESYEPGSFWLQRV
jgi:hypothetical protein